MYPSKRPARRPLVPFAGAAALVLAGLLACAPFAHAASLSLIPKPEGIGLKARDGYESAKALARPWQQDATLVYVEASESLWPDGTADAWTYLFWSPTARVTRGWTVRKGGTAVWYELAFPFSPPPIEDGWMDAFNALEKAGKDPAFTQTKAAGSLRIAMLSNGLSLPDGPGRTTWLFGFGQGASAGREWIGDALRGTPLLERPGEVPETVGDLAGGRAALSPWLSAHGAAAIARSGTGTGRWGKPGEERVRWLSAREGAALERLAGADAAIDTLGRGAVAAAGQDVDASLAALARWHDNAAQADSALARRAHTIEDAKQDLAEQRPTELAVYLVLEARARPATLRVSVDGTEVARAAYGDAEWRALDAGAWAEVARRTVRAGTREVRIDIEGADHKVQSATWRGPLALRQLTLLRLKLSGGERAGAQPVLDFVAATAP